MFAVNASVRIVQSSLMLHRPLKRRRSTWRVMGDMPVGKRIRKGTLTHTSVSFCEASVRRPSHLGCGDVILK